MNNKIKDKQGKKEDVAEENKLSFKRKFYLNNKIIFNLLNYFLI